MTFWPFHGVSCGSNPPGDANEFKRYTFGVTVFFVGNGLFPHRLKLFPATLLISKRNSWH